MRCTRLPQTVFQISLIGLVIIGCTQLAAAVAQAQNDVARDAAAQPAIDPAKAESAFAEAKECFARDDGALWGVNLAAPLMFVDVNSRMIVCNQADAEGKLQQQGDVYVGTLPAGTSIANTAVTWAGTQWAMVMWPLPADEIDRRALLVHESWHRVQDQLGLPSTGPDNSHLDLLEGRIWLQLEWRALATALEATEEVEERKAIFDALIFRAYRRSLFAGAAAAERSLEMHEGLAEYTGYRLAAPRDKDAHDAAKEDAVARERAALILRQRSQTFPTFVRSFAYISGPAYGILLDKFHEGWRKQAATGDFGELLAAGIGVFEIPDDLASEARARAERYDGAALITAENKREEERRAEQAKYEQQFVTGPIVFIPLRNMRMSFNPNAVVPLGDHGTVYGRITITDVWGELTAEEGLLVGKDWRTATLAAGEAAQAGMIAGPGWKLTLKSGWSIQANPDREGSFVLAEDKQR